MLSSDLNLLSYSHVECVQFIGPVSTNRDASYSIAKSVLIAVQCFFMFSCWWSLLTTFPWNTTSLFFSHHLLVGFLLLSTLFPFVKSIFIFVSCFLTVPPQPPVIVGLEREEVKAGRMLVLKCVSHSGNPLATLHWTKVNLPRHLLRCFLTHCHVGKICYQQKSNFSFVGTPSLVASVLHLLHGMTTFFMAFDFYVLICVSEWRRFVHNLGRGCCSTEVHQYPQPEDHPGSQPGSTVLWKHQSGVPIASVCQPQNYCTLWVKIMLNIEHTAGAHTLTHTKPWRDSQQWIIKDMDMRQRNIIRDLPPKPILLLSQHKF